MVNVLGVVWWVITRLTEMLFIVAKVNGGNVNGYYLVRRGSQESEVLSQVLSWDPRSCVESY